MIEITATSVAVMAGVFVAVMAIFIACIKNEIK